MTSPQQGPRRDSRPACPAARGSSPAAMWPLSFAPPGLGSPLCSPTACAVGCILSILRSCFQTHGSLFFSCFAADATALRTDTTGPPGQPRRLSPHGPCWGLTSEVWLLRIQKLHIPKRRPNPIARAGSAQALNPPV